MKDVTCIRLFMENGCEDENQNRPVSLSIGRGVATIEAEEATASSLLMRPPQ